MRQMSQLARKDLLSKAITDREAAKEAIKEKTGKNLGQWQEPGVVAEICGRV